MMRIAVAGGGGLGYMLATSLSQADNAYNVIVLSRTVSRPSVRPHASEWPLTLTHTPKSRPEYAAHDIQVHPVNYYSHESLAYALQGVDLVISTISGPEQLNLILAAGDGHVRHFVPAEFEGSLGHRASHDPLDRSSAQGLDLLRHLDQRKRMRFTVFSCGVLMETFLPCGLGTLGIGYGTGVANTGEYLVNMSTGTAEYPDCDANRQPTRICLTSVYDLVRFMVAAIDLGPGTWPREFTLRGDRMTLRDVVDSCSMGRTGKFEASHHQRRGSRGLTRGVPVALSHQTLHYNDLTTCHDHYTRIGDYARAAYYQRMLATADGRYDFAEATLNEAVSSSNIVNVQPLTFAQWLANVCHPSP